MKKNSIKKQKASKIFIINKQIYCLHQQYAIYCHQDL